MGDMQTLLLGSNIFFDWYYIGHAGPCKSPSVLHAALSPTHRGAIGDPFIRPENGA
jgi:hypothetical protein